MNAYVNSSFSYHGKRKIGVKKEIVGVKKLRVGLCFDKNRTKLPTNWGKKKRNWSNNYQNTPTKSVIEVTFDRK